MMFNRQSIKTELVSTSRSSILGSANTHSVNNPEIVLLSRSVVFENTVFSVYADHISDKSGHEVQQYLSVVPRCLLENAIAGVAVLRQCMSEKLGLSGIQAPYWTLVVGSYQGAH